MDSAWTETVSQKVPEETDITLANRAARLDRASVLYADLANSTSVVDQYAYWFAAAIYKSYLLSAARVVRSEGGSITAYDGDRIMAVFIGEAPETSAVRTALRLNTAVQYVINPLVAARWTGFRVAHKVGVDTGTVRAAKIGIRGANDLVWVGSAANHAAKLAALGPDYSTYITSRVYVAMGPSTTIEPRGHSNVWTPLLWTQQGNALIYATNAFWTQL